MKKILLLLGIIATTQTQAYGYRSQITGYLRPVNPLPFKRANSACQGYFLTEIPYEFDEYRETQDNQYCVDAPKDPELRQQFEDSLYTLPIEIKGYFNNGSFLANSLEKMTCTGECGSCNQPLQTCFISRTPEGCHKQCVRYSW